MDAWRPESMLLAAALLGLAAACRSGPWPRLIVAGGLVGALWFALGGWPVVAATSPAGPHFVVDATAGLVRLFILAAALLAMLNLPAGESRSSVMLAVSALGVLGLSQAATVGGLLLATTTTLLGGSLAAWCSTTGPDRQAVFRWHRTATLGFVLLAAGMVLLAGLAGSLHLGESLQRLGSRPYLPPVALPLLLSVTGVGLALALLGEPGRFGSAVPSALTAWLTTAPVLGLVALLLRVFSGAPGGLGLEPLLTVAAGLLIGGGFVAALAQPQLERRLAWAATGQAGLALVIVATEPAAGHAAAVQHLLVFAAAHLGALLLSRDVDAARQRHRVEPFLLAGLLLSLAALPPLPGWRARIEMLTTLLMGDHELSAGLVLVGTLLGILVYVRPIAGFWRREPVQSAAAGTSLPVSVTAAALLVVLLAHGLGQLRLP